MKRQSVAPLLVMILALTWVSGAGAQEVLQMKAEQEVINIDALYNGTTLSLSGSVPQGCDVLVRFVGVPSELHMKEKGKFLGLLWMNMESLTFTNVPNVYLLGTAEGFQGFNSSAGNQASDLRQLSLEGLKESMQVVPDQADRSTLLGELIKLKQGEGLYRERPGCVSYGTTSAGRKPFQAMIQIPSRLTPGKYTVEAIAAENGHILARKEQNITAFLVGAPAILSNLAFGNGALYGILATVIALISGLVIGLVFQSKGAH